MRHFHGGRTIYRTSNISCDKAGKTCIIANAKLINDTFAVDSDVFEVTEWEKNIIRAKRNNFCYVEILEIDRDTKKAKMFWMNNNTSDACAKKPNHRFNLVGGDQVYISPTQTYKQQQEEASVEAEKVMKRHGINSK